MFKTESRKGIGLASIVALVGSLVAGAVPAQAAGEVSLVTAKGSTYSALAGTTFSFTVNAGSSIPASSWNTLKTKITHTSGSSYSAEASATTGATFTGGVSVTKSATTIVPATVSSTLSAYTVAVGTADSSSDAVVTVQSWLDADGDGTIDAGEFVSDLRTLTFHKTSAITWTTALTAPVLQNGNSTLSAVVSTNVELNMSQLPTGEVKVAFATVSGTAYTAQGTATSHSSGVFNNGETASAVATATTTAKAELGGISISAGATYVAVAIVDGIEASAEVYSVVSTANVSNIDALKLTKNANSTGSGQIRAGSAIALELTSVVSKSAGVAAAAGTLVTVTITEGANMTSVSAVVAGGKTLANASSTNASENISFTVAVDSKGAVKIPVAATLKHDQAFKVQLSADNVVSAEFTVTAKDTVYGSIVDMNTIGSSVLKVTSGTSVALNWAVLDNFGAGITGDYRIYLTGGATASAAVSAGQATVNVTPTATTTYTAQLQKFNSSTLVYENVSGASDTHAVTVGASNAAATVTLVASSASNLVINDSALAAVDTRLGAEAPTLTTGNRATLSGQVTDANGIATYGVVTLSAPNVMFKVGDVYSLGSATVQTSAAGAYGDVVVYSNTAGKVTVSAVVGSAKKDLGLEYLAVTESSGAKWVITAPSQVAPGSTAQFKAQLLDTWSNPVKVTSTNRIAITYTGPGFVTATLPNTTGTDGMLSFSVLYGTADEGSASVKFSYDGDGSTSTTTDAIASTVTTTIGAAEVNAVVGSFKGRWAVRIENGKGSTIAVRAGGRWFKYVALNDNYLFSRKSRVGAELNVKVYVDGALQEDKTITVK